MTEERYKQIKDSIELQSLVKKQMGVEDELLQEEVELLKAYEKLQKENKQLKGIIKENTILVKDEYGDYQECNINPLRMKQKYKKQVDNWDKLKEYFNERIEVCDNRLSSPFCNFEKATKERLIFSQCLEKLEELEGSESE